MDGADLLEFAAQTNEGWREALPRSVVRCCSSRRNSSGGLLLAVLGSSTPSAWWVQPFWQRLGSERAQAKPTTGWIAF